MDRAAPSIFDRLNQAEPFIAIRLLLLQVGFALGLTWLGGTGIAPGEDGVQILPFSLAGAYLEQSAVDLGYPVREVVWSGEWWRIVAGAFLPPGLWWFIFSMVAFLPLARYVETEWGRYPALCLYIAGGLTVTILDVIGATLVTAGSVGMVFAAAGAVLKGVIWDHSPAPRPPSTTWLAMMLLWGFAWVIHSAPFYLWYFDFSPVITQVSPFHHSLSVAMVVGIAFGFFPRKASVAAAPMRFGGVVSRGILLILAWVAALGGLCWEEWKGRGEVDYQLWKLDPLLREGDRAAQTALAELAALHPDDEFLEKRLAISHAFHGQHAEADAVLASLIRKATGEGEGPSSFLLERLRQGRSARLNRRSAWQVDPPRYSGLAARYQFDRLRLHWDRAHVARLFGTSEELTALRVALVQEFESRVLPELEEDTPEDERKSRSEALRLNNSAYVKAELGGNVAEAIEEASRAVSIDPDADHLDTWGWALVQAGETEKGIEQLKKALLIADSLSLGTIHYHLGMAYLRAGNVENGENHLREAARLGIDWWEELEVKRICPSCLKSNSTLTSPLLSGL